MPGVGGFEPRHCWRCPHAHSDNNNSRQPGALGACARPGGRSATRLRFRHEQPQLRRQSFKPRRQDLQTIKKVPQRLHPLCPGRPKLVLIRVHEIGATSATMFSIDDWAEAELGGVAGVIGSRYWADIKSNVKEPASPRPRNKSLPR